MTKKYRWVSPVGFSSPANAARLHAFLTEYAGNKDIVFTYHIDDEGLAFVTTNDYTKGNDTVNDALSRAFFAGVVAESERATNGDDCACRKQQS